VEPFRFVRAEDDAAALREIRTERAAFVAGGTSIVDLMKLGLERPSTLVDLNRVGLDVIEQRQGDIFLGATARNSDAANHPLVAAKAPALREALLSGASPQLRNMATIAGNLLQRTRCSYFRDPQVPCNKKAPGAGCPAMDGYNRMHALLGTSKQCIAAHPSDMCVALMALGAVIHVANDRGSRTIAMGDFHLVPGDTPHLENSLQPGDLVTGVSVPATALSARSRYVKVRDRASFAFALASAAAALEVDGGVIRDARVALGGVSTKPWRSTEAERVLVGQRPAETLFRAAASAALKDAVPREHNGFKIELAKRVIVRALSLSNGSQA
jgi:xanthine dehydrogenase YagS FAD-binding subunit